MAAAFGIATNSTHVFIFGRSPDPPGTSRPRCGSCCETPTRRPASWTEIAIADNHEAYGIYASDLAVILVGRTLEEIPDCARWRLLEL
ncbi:MAG: hypothetical protein H6746_15715 [Deltaproteobacteria bacterium]|nr:hypothetical protein [Deltaproteobacteria bacterium]